MSQHVVLLSIPGLRAEDLEGLPTLKKLAEGGETLPLVPSLRSLLTPMST